MIYKRKNALETQKHGVKMWIYGRDPEVENAAVAYQETETGHAQEFYHETSAFVFYIVEGEGVWIIEGEEHPVEASDVVVVPPGKKFYYRGNLKQICVTAPAWNEEHEKHVRFINL